MIGKLRGILTTKKPPDLLLDVNGVFYELQTPLSSFYKLPELGQEITLLTHFIVREDAQLLFGFVEEQERELFRNLIKVNGIGPKLALAILSSLEPDIFVTCIMNSDEKNLIRIPGLGKKTAQRLIVEMRDKLSAWQADDNGVTFDATESGNVLHDAVSALIALGYKAQDANRAIVKFKGQNLSSEELIKLALKEIM